MQDRAVSEGVKALGLQSQIPHPSAYHPKEG